MPNSPATVENVLPQLRDWAASGQEVCLATLVYADSSSPRPRGSQMAVAADGSWFGYLTGGCAEAAIAAEAVAVIGARQSRATRFGIGSPYLDVQLPCGAGIDVWFDRCFDARLAEQLLQTLAARQVCGIETSVGPENTTSRIVSPAAGAVTKRSFRRWYLPQRRLYVVGTGPGVAALVALASAADYEVQVLSPDRQTLEGIPRDSCSAQLLEDQSQIDALEKDRWSAVVLLFHEHERETAILKNFLDSDVYYIGALGSQRTHRVRLDLLRETGVADDAFVRIHGPVGLDIQAHTPAEIGISVLAELTQTYQAGALTLLDWNGGALTGVADVV